MNLHEWITARVGTAEVVARAATPDPWEAVVDRHQHGVVDASVWADAIGYYIAEKVSSGDRHEADARHIGTSDPTAVLRRCEADRRVLARHHLPDLDDWMYPGCYGCGTEGHMDNLVTENINECPELLDLAHAHGITEQELAALDRPERAPRPTGPVIGHATIAVTAAMTTDQVPPALRGVHWGRRH